MKMHLMKKEYVYTHFSEASVKSYQKNEQIYLRVAVNVIGVQCKVGLIRIHSNT